MRVQNPVVMFLAAVVIVTLHGCATTDAEKTVDRRLAEENSVDTRSELRTETDNLIENAPDLSTDQRVKLSRLRQEITTKTDALARESIKLRSLLVQDLISPAYNDKVTSLVETKLKKVEKERLDLVLDSIKRAKTILGRQVLSNARIMDDLASERRLPISKIE